MNTKPKPNDNPIIGYEHSTKDGKLIQGNPIYLKDLPLKTRETKESSTDFNLMIDLETLGVTPGCGILAIGATSLDLKHRFYEKVKSSSNRSYRLRTDQSTLDWWDGQSEASRSESFSGTEDLAKILLKFNDFLKELPLEGKELKIWGNGADFDLPILRVAYQETRVFNPIPPFSARCYRTMKSLFPEVEKPKFVGEQHTAIADARNQAEHLNLILNLIK